MNKPQSLSTFLSLVQGRRSIYDLSADSPIPDSEIEDLVKFAIQWCPSAWNVQSARAMVLFGSQHQKLWDIVDQHMASQDLNEYNRAYVSNKMSQFKNSYGTIMWFEDQAPLDALLSKFPFISSTLPQWSDHSSGMHQFVVWTALEAAGLGANLQHYNSELEVVPQIMKAFDIPSTWKLNAQLVFGKPAGDPKEKTFEPIDPRVVVKPGK